MARKMQAMLDGFQAAFLNGRLGVVVPALA